MSTIPRRYLATITVLTFVALWSPHAVAEDRISDQELLRPMGVKQQRAHDAAGYRLARKDYAGAIRLLDEAIALQPRFAVAITERGFAYVELGDLPKALADMDAVVRLAPDNANALTNSCWVRALSSVELDQALALCDRALAIRRDNKTLDSRGMVHFRRGEYQAAADDYAAANALVPAASTLYMRGLSLTRAGATETGQADIDKALRMDRHVTEKLRRWGVLAGG
jgi:tetratricopeptide (TPR) repeat protein